MSTHSALAFILAPILSPPKRGSVRIGLSLCLALVVSGPALAAEAPLPPLTTLPKAPRLPGKFVWADLVTDDVPAARNFYGRLLNWTFRDVGGYVIAANDERPLCGLFQRTRPTGRPEAKPRWFAYLSVPSVEKVHRAVTAAGGRVLAAPRHLPQRGEQAVFADPEGAIFGVVKSSAGDPPDFLAEPGDWIWIQLLSRDARKAADFYRSVGGYEVLENPATNRLSDFVLTSKGYARATVRTLPATREPVAPNWLPFVRVKSLAESLVLTRQLGGKVVLEPRPQWLEGRVGVIADPTGAALGLMEWTEPAQKGDN